MAIVGIDHASADKPFGGREAWQRLLPFEYAESRQNRTSWGLGGAMPESCNAASQRERVSL